MIEFCAEKCYNGNTIKSKSISCGNLPCERGEIVLNNLGRGSENNGKNKEGIFTRETAGIVLVLFAVLALVVLLTRDIIFGKVGFAISSFLLGSFGYCSVALLASLVYAGIVLITGKKISANGKTVAFCALFFVSIVCLVHTITATIGGIEYGGYGKYLHDCYAAGENSFFQTTAGGALFGLVVYPVGKLTTSIGGYIIFSLLAVCSAYLIYASRVAAKMQKRSAAAPSEYATSDTSALYDLNYAAAPQPQGEDAYSAPVDYSPQPQQQNFGAPAQTVQMTDTSDRSRRLYAIGDDFDFKTKREIRQETRREEEERRMRESAAQSPQSVYEQGRSILYPDRPAMEYPPLYSTPTSKITDGGDYSWYAQNYAGGKSPSISRTKSSSSSSSGSLYNSNGGYTSNRIFDENSPFNRPNRARDLAQSYANNFGGTSSFSQGHELKSKRSAPAQPQNAQQPSVQPQNVQSVQSQPNVAPTQSGTYSQIYADAAEGNISYENRPRKIVADATGEGVQKSETQKENYYRNDVSPAAEATVRASYAADNSVQNRVASVSSDSQPPMYGSAAVSERTSRETAHIDVSDTMRRAGFGGSERTRRRDAAESVIPSESARPNDFSQSSAAPASRADSADLLAEPKTDRCAPSAYEDASSVRRAESLPRGTEAENARRGSQADSLSDEEISGSARMRGRSSTSESSVLGETLGNERSDLRGGREEPVRGERVEPIAEPTEERTVLRPISDELESAVGLFDDEPESSVVPEAFERTSRREERVAEPPVVPLQRERVQQEMPKEENRPRHVYAKYKAPPLNLLKDYPRVDISDNEEVENNKAIIVETLAGFRIDCIVEKVTHGPAVTRYEISIPGNITISRVLSCKNELAMRLHAKDGVNVQTNYESGFISIEVPNEKKETVGLKDMLLSSDFVNAKVGALAFGIGKDIEGKAVCGDVVKMTHLLVAGATNSGKSVCLHALILSLLFKYSPEELRLVLVDPKQNEFAMYDKLPHLLIPESIAEPAKVINVMNWLITEMERRYSLFKEKTRKGTVVRDVNDYNACLTADEEKLPKIVMIIDELADLMSVAKKDIEDRIQRLTQKSRAAGIHLVLATQRPSVNVITGVIKSNLPTRIALKVTQEVDSRTILDESGAENLLGQGDLLFRSANMTFPRRVQGAFVTNGEIQEIVTYIKENNEAYFDDKVSDYINNERAGGGEYGEDDDSVEAVYIEALNYVVQAGQASISMIQRRCSVGYPKAGKIIEWMENMGYISPFNGSKAREVLLSREEFDSKYGDCGV